MGRIRNTIELAKTSWGVLQKDRELVILPVLSFIAAALVFAVFVIPGVLALPEETTSAATTEEQPIPALSVILFVLGSLAATVVSVFFTGALVAGAHERMSGGDPTVGSAIGKATQRIPGLVPWALLTATVGMIIQALRERAGAIGGFLLGGIDLAWNVASFLTIPAIVIDDKGPIDGFKSSAGLLRQTWGENLASQVGFGLVGFVAAIPAIVLVAIAAAANVTAFLVAAFIIAAAWIALVLAVISALGGIFKAALYMYATQGRAPEGFEQANLGGTFTRR
ncbi:MAG: DUF6159 family protein [Actinomycetota bacterium]